MITPNEYEKFLFPWKIRVDVATEPTANALVMEKRSFARVLPYRELVLVLVLAVCKGERQSDTVVRGDSILYVIAGHCVKTLWQYNDHYTGIRLQSDESLPIIIENIYLNTPKQ